jgi:photosystem II stability/assembly factor-like uncharacterized protein
MVLAYAQGGAAIHAQAGIESDADLRLFAGTDSGLFVSGGPDSAWRQIPMAGKNPDVLTIAVQDRHIVAGSKYDGYFVSHDSGATWIRNAEGRLDKVIALDTLLFALAGDASVSSDHGGTWVQLGVAGWSLYRVGGVLLVGGRDRVTVSADRGKTWAILPQRASGSMFTSTFLGVGNDLWNYGSEGVYSWSGPEKTWKYLALYQNNVYAMAQDDSAVFAGTAGGFRRSEDHGTHWIASDSGMEGAIVLAIASDERRLFAGTVGRVYQSPDGGRHWLPRGDRLPGARLNCLIAAALRREEEAPPGLDPQADSAHPIKDFCPLEQGQIWRYRRSYNYDGLGSRFAEQSIRTLAVLSESTFSAGIRFRIRLTDSIVATDLHPATQYSYPHPEFGVNRATDVNVFQDTSGRLRVVYADSAYLKRFSGKSEFADNMLGYAFRSHEYGSFWISDTSLTHNKPEVAIASGSPGDIFRQGFAIRKDVGLFSYDLLFVGWKESDKWHYELMDFQDQHFTTDNRRPSARSPERTRPRIRFTGNGLIILDRGMDGRRIR